MTKTLVEDSGYYCFHPFYSTVNLEDWRETTNIKADVTELLYTLNVRDRPTVDTEIMINECHFLREIQLYNYEVWILGDGTVGSRSSL